MTKIGIVRRLILSIHQPSDHIEERTRKLVECFKHEYVRYRRTDGGTDGRGA